MQNVERRMQNWRDSWRAVFVLSAVLCSLRTEGVTPAQNLAQQAVTRSVSGQFIVRSISAASTASAPLTNQLRLEPTLVAVSCERIKHDLQHELAFPAAWQGKVFIGIYPAGSVEQPVTILSERLREGWQYKIELPDAMEPMRYVRAMVQVLLLEFANRSAATRSAEIPAWLTEGLAQQIMALDGIQIILPPPRPGAGTLSLVSTNFNARRDNPLEAAHRTFQTHAPLSFEALSWPRQEQWSGEPAEIYRQSAQLFLNELLALKDGRACVRAMLSELPQYYNWQFAFLKAFAGYFQRTLDVEKWWALQVLHFSAHDLLSQSWSFDESRQKLEELLRSPVEVQAGTNGVPLQAEVPLQKVIREWHIWPQPGLLEGKVRELQVFHTRVAPEFVSLVDSYHQALASFMQHPDKSGGKTTGRAAAEAINQLDELDALRAAVRPQKGLTAGQP